MLDCLALGCLCSFFPFSPPPVDLGGQELAEFSQGSFGRANGDPFTWHSSLSSLMEIQSLAALHTWMDGVPFNPHSNLAGGSSVQVAQKGPVICLNPIARS